MKIICISGHAQNGKDTFATYLLDVMQLIGRDKVLIVHYADLLKYVCRQFFDWDGMKDDHGRGLLQHVGTDVVRSKAPDYWAKFIVDIISFFPDKWDYIIIPDCRFENEIQIFKDAGYDVIHARVERDGYDNHLTDEQKNHKSETALDGTTPDVVIKNNGGLFDLIKSAVTFIGEYIL